MWEGEASTMELEEACSRLRDIYGRSTANAPRHMLYVSRIQGLLDTLA